MIVDVTGRRMTGRVPVAFVTDPHLRRVVVFGGDRHNNGDPVTVNGVSLSIAGLAVVEQADRSWRAQPYGMRRWGTHSDDVPAGASAAVRAWAEQTATRLAETVPAGEWPLVGSGGRPDYRSAVADMRRRLEAAELFASFSDRFHDGEFDVEPRTSEDPAHVRVDAVLGGTLERWQHYGVRVSVVGRLVVEAWGERMVVGYVVASDRASFGEWHTGPVPVPVELCEATT